MALSEAAQKVIGNTKELTHSFTVDDAPDSQSQASAAPPVGPTGFWGRIEQVGIGKVNLLNAAKVVKGAAVEAGKSVVSLSEDVGKGVVKANPFRGSSDTSSSEILKAQDAAKQAIQSGKVSLTTNKANTQAASLQALKIVADPKLTDAQKQEQLKPIVAKRSAEENKAIGDALQIASLAVGGGETAELLKGGTSLFKGLAVNAVSGAVGNVGSTLSSNPTATKKDLVKSGEGGAAFGVGTALLGAIGGKLAGDVKTILGENEELNTVVKNVAANKLLQKGEEANRPIKVGVQDVGNGAEKVGVKTPVHPGIKEVSETNKINVRTPNQMSGKDYLKELTKISKNYDKSSAALKDFSPAEQKAKIEVIDRQHQKAVAELNDKYNKPELTAPKAPKKLESKVSPAGKTTGGIPKKFKTSTSAETSIGKADKAETKTTQAGKLKTAQSVVEGESKISGSALKSEQKAVEANLTDEFKDKASYDATGYKKNSEDAVKLVHEDPQKAMDIATGKTPGNNTVHEVAVARALENKAIKDGDIDTLTRLASSSRHTETSEAAQRLGAEGYGVSNSPVKNIKTVMDARVAAVESKTKVSVASATKDTVKAIKSSIKAPTKSEWKIFLESNKC